ncbi:MAG: succinate dehydrogenase, hydrophobic membrane anchor protein [Bradyrhizobiaceae bacterium]|nr:MAG: succinate dehydrogenase, hydrophobic membrane anchor protein [Bradyrhizobiaceae bacterium]
MSALENDKKPASMRTPLSRVRYLGSAHSGTSDFFRQRMTAVAMILLFLPIIVIIVGLTGRSQVAAAQILGSPVVAILMILFIISSVWHMKIGMQVVIEDYVTSEKLKLAAVIFNQFFAFTVGLASIFAIIKLSSGV